MQRFENKRSMRVIVYALFSVFILFLIYLAINDSVHKNGIKVVHSIEDVITYENKMTPGLSRAEALGFVTEIDERMTVGSSGLTLTIDKAWYNSEQIYLFYNIDLPEKPEKLHEISFFLYMDSDVPSEPFQSSAYTGNWGHDDGIIYDGRYYGRLIAARFRNESGIVSRIDEIKLDDLFVRIDDKKVKLDPITINMNVDLQEEPIRSLPLNETLEVLGHQLTFIKMEIGIARNVLYFQHEGPEKEKQFTRLNAEIKAVGENGREHTIQTNGFYSSGPNDWLAVEFEPFDFWPEEMELVVSGIEWVGVDEFSFDVDVTDYHEKMTDQAASFDVELEQSIGTIKNTDIVLQSLHYDDRGVMWSIRYDYHQAEKPYRRLVTSVPRLLESVKNMQHLDFPLEKHPMLGIAKGDNDETVRFGQRGGGSGHTFGAFLQAEDLQGVETVTVTLKQLPVEIVMDWSSAFTIPKEEQLTSTVDWTKHQQRTFHSPAGQFIFIPVGSEHVIEQDEAYTFYGDYDVYFASSMTDRRPQKLLELTKVKLSYPLEQSGRTEMRVQAYDTVDQLRIVPITVRQDAQTHLYLFSVDAAGESKVVPFRYQRGSTGTESLSFDITNLVESGESQSDHIQISDGVINMSLPSVQFIENAESGHMHHLTFRFDSDLHLMELERVGETNADGEQVPPNLQSGVYLDPDRFTNASSVEQEAYRFLLNSLKAFSEHDQQKLTQIFKYDSLMAMNREQTIYRFDQEIENLTVNKHPAYTYVIATVEVKQFSFDDLNRESRSSNWSFVMQKIKGEDEWKIEDID